MKCIAYLSRHHSDWWLLVRIVKSVCNFASCTAVMLPCSGQNFKAIGQLEHELWANEISRDLSLRWISDGYPILHSAPGLIPSEVNKATLWFATSIHRRNKYTRLNWTRHHHYHGNKVFVERKKCTSWHTLMTSIFLPKDIYNMNFE